MIITICLLETGDDQKTKSQDAHSEQGKDTDDTVQDIYATVNKNKQPVYANV